KNGDYIVIRFCYFYNTFVMFFIMYRNLVDRRILPDRFGQPYKIIGMGKKALLWVIIRVVDLIPGNQPKSTIFAKLLFKFVDGQLVYVGVSGKGHKVAHIVQFQIICQRIGINVGHKGFQSNFLRLGYIRPVIVYKDYMAVVLLQITGNEPRGLGGSDNQNTFRFFQKYTDPFGKKPGSGRIEQYRTQDDHKDQRGYILRSGFPIVHELGTKQGGNTGSYNAPWAHPTDKDFFVELQCRSL